MFCYFFSFCINTLIYTKRESVLMYFSEGKVTMEVKATDYLDKLVDMCLIKISCMVRVQETNQFHCESDDFRLLKPDISIQVRSVRNCREIGHSVYEGQLGQSTCPVHHTLPHQTSETQKF